MARAPLWQVEYSCNEDGQQGLFNPCFHSERLRFRAIQIAEDCGWCAVMQEPQYENVFIMAAKPWKYAPQHLTVYWIKAFIRSMKAMHRGDFSRSWSAVKIMSVVPLDGWKPHVIPGSTSSDSGRGGLTRTWGRTFPVVDRSKMPLVFPASALSPFANMVKIWASQLWGKLFSFLDIEKYMVDVMPKLWSMVGSASLCLRSVPGSYQVLQPCCSLLHIFLIKLKRERIERGWWGDKCLKSAIT